MPGQQVDNARTATVGRLCEHNAARRKGTHEAIEGMGHGQPMVSSVGSGRQAAFGPDIRKHDADVPYWP
jgi:hypothetical protein